MLDGIRRALGLHIHDWEVVGSRETFMERAGRSFSASTGEGAAFTPENREQVPVEILTFKCKTCGKQRESRIGGV